MDHYNKALSINPNFAPALGNKAVALSYLAFNVHGYVHVCLFEAKKMLEIALSSQQIHQTMRNGFIKRLNQIKEIINNHENGFFPEKIDNEEARSSFHRFLRDFSNKYNLFLSPTIGIKTKSNQIYKDVLFPSALSGNIITKRVEKCISYINQIKQDYAFSRYLLAQSQYPSNTIEVIDKDVDLYNPFDYSVFSSYIEMMKVSFRISFGILDKIASFTHFYFGLSKPKLSQTYFINVWHQPKKRDQLQEILREQQNLFLLGLFDLSKDIYGRNVSGFGFHKKRRNALTHRFLSIYEFFNSSSDYDSDCVSRDDFFKECIKALQISRSAIFYMVQMVEREEKIKGESARYYARPLEKYHSFY